MLLHLKIKNIAVIEEAELDFHDGFNVLTGETGAGKSILIDSISMLTGVHSNRELIRMGEETASVYGLFSPPEKVWKILAESGMERSEDGLLSVSRELYVSGKSVCRINGTPCPLGVLKSIGAYLINIHGQQDALELYAPEKHITLLDKWCGEELKALLADYRESYKAYVTAAKESRALRALAEKRDGEIDYLEFEINEIESAEISVGEEKELSEKRLALSNREKISRAISEINDSLFAASGSARERIDLSVRKLEGVAKYDASLDKTVSALRDVLYALDDAGEVLRKSDGISSEELLGSVTDRLDIIHRIMRKYGGSEEAVLARLEQSKTRLAELKNSVTEENRLDGEMVTLKAEIEKKAEKLHFLREQYGKKLSEEIIHELSDLGMNGCEFTAVIKKIPYGGLGCDSVEFFISPNRGEGLKPLSKIASGGELSRIMLAIKCIMARTDDSDAYVFDEIDSGVSGRAAEKVAAKLRTVGALKQTFVITHLGHIAAAGKHHFRIEKNVEGGRTKTCITLLDREGRIREIARINSGSNISETALLQAEELLENAEKI